MIVIMQKICINAWIIILCIFIKDEKKYIEVIENELKNYVNNNLQELAEYWVAARSVDSKKDLSQMVTPKTLLFKQDGTTVMLHILDFSSGENIEK